jgi:hypothetical protein
MSEMKIDGVLMSRLRVWNEAVSLSTFVFNRPAGKRITYINCLHKINWTYKSC